MKRTYYLLTASNFKKQHYVVQTELRFQNSDLAMIFTFPKRSYGWNNKKWTNFGCILKIDPTGVAHALGVDIKEGSKE